MKGTQLVIYNLNVTILQIMRLKGQAMNLQTEKDLIVGALSFDMNCLAEIYDRYSQGLFIYSVRLLGEDQLAKDCVAETYSRFLKALRDGKGPQEYLRAYLYRIAHNWITDIYRRQPPPPLELKETIQDDQCLRPEEQMAERMENDQVRAALYRLPPEQRQVITLKYVEGWDNDQVAAALQKPAGTIRVIQHRALAAMRNLLLLEER
jgi:RNA polymerase sigma-70 factor (ECF subfamily)